MDCCEAHLRVEGVRTTYKFVSAVPAEGVTFTFGRVTVAYAMVKDHLLVQGSMLRYNWDTSYRAAVRALLAVMERTQKPSRPSVASSSRSPLLARD